MTSALSLPPPTQRLVLRCLTLDDAAFIVELLNEPDWLRFIGDKHVHSVDDARRYLTAGPLRLYEQHGFGLFAVVLRDSGVPIGLAGLIKRPELDDVDLGFAFLERYRRFGYAHEASVAIIDHAGYALHLRRIVAITALDSARSIDLLKRLGFQHEQTLRLGERGDDSHVFARTSQPAA